MILLLIGPLISLVNIIIFSVVAHNIRRKAIRSNIRDLVIISLSFFMSWIVFYNIFYYYNFDIMEIKYIIFWITNSLIVLVAFVFSNTVKLIFSNKIGIKRSMLLVTIFTTNTISSYMLVFHYPMLNDELILVLINLTKTMIGFAICVILLSISHDFRVFAEDISGKNSFFEMVHYKNSVYFMIFVLPIAYLSFYYQFDEVLLYQLIVFLAGIYVLRLVLRTDKIRFFEPNQYFSVMIINNSGNLLYERNFLDSEELERDSIFVGWLHTLSQLVSDYLEGRNRPEVIILQGGIRIYINWQKRFSVAVLIDKVSPLVKPALDKSSRIISRTIHDKSLEYGIISDDESELIDGVIKEKFSFIDDYIRL